VRVLVVDEVRMSGMGAGCRIGGGTQRTEREGRCSRATPPPAASGIAVRRTLLRFGAAVQRSGVTNSVLPQGHQDGPALVHDAEGPQHPPAADRVHLDYPIDEMTPAFDQLGGTHPQLHGALHSWRRSAVSMADDVCSST
jgi:hypothetical protein